RGLAAACRLEVDACGYAERASGAELHSRFGNRIATFDHDLINASRCLALGTERLIDLRGVDTQRRFRRRSLRRAERSLALRQLLLDCGRDLCRIAMTRDVAIECFRIRAEQMIVDGGDLEAASDHLA